MNEIIKKLEEYAILNNQNIFTKEEVLNVVGRDGMHALLKWDGLIDEGNDQYRFIMYEVQ